jgi:hypothetical protein
MLCFFSQKTWEPDGSIFKHSTSVFFVFDLVFLHVFMQISPASVRGTYGSLLQIASCVGILAALVAGLPAHLVPGWYVVEIPSCWRDVCATFAYIHYFLFFHCVVVKLSFWELEHGSF